MYLDVSKIQSKMKEPNVYFTYHHFSGSDSFPLRLGYFSKKQCDYLENLL